MSTTDGESLLSLEDLRVHFSEETAVMEALPGGIKRRMGWEPGAIRAVDGVSLDIEESDVVAIVGESGSGKTTLGKTAVGLQTPTAGSVKYRGHDIDELRENGETDGVSFADARKALQIVHQDPGAALNPYRTIMASLREPLNRWYPELNPADAQKRIFNLFEECGLTPVEEYEDRYPHELSGGEKQRVTLIRAMLVEPDLILADEPVSALDPSLRVDLMDLMLELQETFETSFLFISHNLEHTRYFASQADGRLGVMYLGELVEFGPVEEVLQNPKHPYTQILKWATLPIHPDEARATLEQESPLRGSEAPDAENPPSGCRFHTRCPKAREACVDQTPDLLTGGDGAHRAACYREDPDHEYWDTEPLAEDGEREIPD
jgi:peptide/nickel transport system ATP-binding protein